MNKMNECWIRDKEEMEQINKVSKTTKPSYRSPLAGLQRPLKIHHSNFSNVN